MTDRSAQACRGSGPLAPPLSSAHYDCMQLKEIRSHLPSGSPAPPSSSPPASSRIADSRVRPAAQPDSLLRDTLIGMCTEGASRISGWESRRRIADLRKATGCSRQDLRDFWADPEATLGPFDRLPDNVQEALADAAYWHFEERHLLISDALYRRVRGPVYRVGSDFTHVSWKWRLRWANARLLRRLARVLFVLGRALTSGSLWAGQRWVALTRFTSLSSGPFLQRLWEYSGVDLTEMVQTYILKIPIDPRVGPVYIHKGNCVVSCALAGLDLLSSGGRLYFLESNFDPGFRASRLRIFPAGDPVCLKLVSYARTRGYTRIVFHPWRKRALFPAELEAAWKELAERQGVALEIRDNPDFRSPYQRPAEPLMDPDAVGTMYANSRRIDSPLGTLISRKGLVDRLIARRNARVPEEERIAMPRLIMTDEDLPPSDPASRFPNLIVKNCLKDKVKGIALYNVNRLPAGANTWPNAAYEFIRPDCVSEQGGGARRDYAFIYRAYLLIAPDGPVYLGARKDISATAVPDHLPRGKLPDISPYVTNIGSLQGYAVIPSAAEEELIEAAVLGVGAAVAEFVAEKHDLVLDGKIYPTNA